MGRVRVVVRNGVKVVVRNGVKSMVRRVRGLGHCCGMPQYPFRREPRRITLPSLVLVPIIG
jgi:hypothetical protein